MAAAPSSLSQRDLFERLAQGHAARITVVTPNRRLSQALQWDFGSVQANRGLRVWETADILPFGAFAERLWEDALYREGASGIPLLLTPAQEQALWEEIVRASKLAEALLSVAATASQCREAWQLGHAWRLMPKLSALAFNEDAKAFLDWSSRYERATKEKHQTDSARLPDAVIPLLPDDAVRKPKTLVLFGFDTVTPQQQALLDALALQGVEVLTSRMPAQSSKALRLEFTSVKEEVFAAAKWARARLEAGGEKVRIGIVVPDLAQSRGLVQRTLASILQPQVLLPEGLLPDAGKQPSPFDLSLGLPLTDYPLVHDALLVLQMAGRDSVFNDVSCLIRSPFLAAAESEMTVRARLDAAMRERAGLTLTLERLLRLFAMNGVPRSPVLAERFSRLADFRKSDLLGTKTASEWAKAFSEALRIVGFPGERTLDSHEYQTLKKWHEVLAGFATLERVTGKMSYEQACRRLRRMAADTLFQPEAPDVPIQVLGVLESAGLRFDSLWVMGLADETWPLPARPNPFIPIRLQREAGIPYADAASSLERGRRMTQDWLAAAAEVIVSHARMKDDSELAPSPLIAAIEKGNADELGIPAYDTLRNAIHRAYRVEKIDDGLGPSIEDSRGPPISTTVQEGGTAIFKDQAACPFRAFARYRLGSTPLETPHPGLDAADRGTLLHHMLAAVWKSLENKTRLDSIESGELDELLTVCADEAIARVRRYRPDALDERFAVIEKARLVRLTRDWLALEKARGDFEVIAIERKRPILFGGVTVNAKLDRMDRLASGEGTGNRVIIDYKTGKCAVSAWLGRRPDEPQLPMYALGAEENVAAIAFAQLKTGDLKFKGLANAEGVLPGVTLITKDRSKPAKNYSDWNALVTAWRAELEALGRGFASGDARVDPKRGDRTCRECDQHLFCRIAEKAPSLSGENPEEGDDD